MKIFKKLIDFLNIVNEKISYLKKKTTPTASKTKVQHLIQ